MNLTWQLTLIIAIAIIALAWIITLEYRRPERKDQKKFRDPIVTTAIVSLVIIAMILIMEGFEILPEGWAKEHWWVFILLILGIFYMTYRALQRLKPMKMSKLIDRGWDFIYDWLKAKPHRGAAFGPPLPTFKIISTTDDDVFNKVVLFLYHTNVGPVLLGLDINNAYPVEYMHNPEEPLIRKRFGKDIAQQFDLERELIKKELTAPEPYTQENGNSEDVQASA